MGGSIGPGVGAQRAMPLGAAMHVPEQQFWSVAHRS